MIRPFLCGIQSCNPIEARGNHGFMKSIEKDLPRQIDFNSSNLLKQKISLKHISNKQSKNSTTCHIKSQANKSREIQKQQKHSPGQPKKLESFDGQILRANNTIGQFGELGQNGRNLLCLKISPNQHQIIRRNNFCSKDDKLKKLSQNLVNNAFELDLSKSSKNHTHCIQKAVGKTTINLPKTYQIQPLVTLNKNPKLAQYNTYIQKQNIVRHLNVCQHESNFKQIKGTTKQTIGQQLQSHTQLNKVAQIKSQKSLHFNQTIVSPTKMIEITDRKIHKILPKQDLTSKPIILNSCQTIRLKNLNENLVSTKIKQNQSNDKRLGLKFQKEYSKAHFSNLTHKCSQIGVSSLFPSNETSMFSMKKNDKKNRLDCSKNQNSNVELITRQNSKISVSALQNPKFQTQTTLTNESNYQEYQNHKDFDHRFNMSRFFNTSNFGAQSHLEKTHSYISKPNSQNQINPNIVLNEKNTDQQKVKKDLNSVLTKKNSIDDESLHKTNSIKSPKHQKLETQSYEMRNLNSIDCQSIKNYQNKKNYGKKKNRSSFFQQIEKNKIKESLRNAVQSHLSQTIRSEQSNSQNFKQLSLINMKNVQSFVNSEGTISQQESQLEFAIHFQAAISYKDSQV